MYYHVGITTKHEPKQPVMAFDMSAADLERKVCAPYRQGGTIALGGHIVATTDMGFIRLSRTEIPAADVVAEIAKDRDARRLAEASQGVHLIYEPVTDEQVILHGENVTEELLGGAPGSENAPTDATAQQHRNRAAPRAHLIPGDCNLHIDTARANSVAEELGSLELATHPNAVAVLLRVFVELSVDEYIVRAKLPKGDTLGKRLLATTNDLESSGKLSRDQAVAGRSAAEKQSFGAPSLPRLNQWVHNQHMFPGPADLRAEWDGLQPLLEAIWAPPESLQACRMQT